MRARDRFWLWGHPAGSHDSEWGLPSPSRITPVEAAFYMGIPNVIMVRYGSAPWPPERRDLVPFRGLPQVVWSVVGAGGAHRAEETARVLGLADDLPNMTGVIMDDFFKASPEAREVGILSSTELIALRKRLSSAGRGLPLWVVLYGHQLDLPVTEHLGLCDKITFWTWEARNLRNLENNFARMERLAPAKCGKVLGCYMWDYGTQQAMPPAAMQRQCELGMRWLREGRIEGMIFLASCICDLDLETVEWTRRWIAEAGDQGL